MNKISFLKTILKCAIFEKYNFRYAQLKKSLEIILTRLCLKIENYNSQIFKTCAIF